MGTVSRIHTEQNETPDEPKESISVDSFFPESLSEEGVDREKVSDLLLTDLKNELLIPNPGISSFIEQAISELRPVLAESVQLQDLTDALQAHYESDLESEDVIIRDALRECRTTTVKILDRIRFTLSILFTRNGFSDKFDDFMSDANKVIDLIASHNHAQKCLSEAIEFSVETILSLARGNHPKIILRDTKRDMTRSKLKLIS